MGWERHRELRMRPLLDQWTSNMEPVSRGENRAILANLTLGALAAWTLGYWIALFVGDPAPEWRTPNLVSPIVVVRSLSTVHDIGPSTISVRSCVTVIVRPLWMVNRWQKSPAVVGSGIRRAASMSRWFSSLRSTSKCSRFLPPANVWNAMFGTWSDSRYGA